MVKRNRVWTLLLALCLLFGLGTSASAYTYFFVFDNDGNFAGSANWSETEGCTMQTPFVKADIVPTSIYGTTESTTYTLVKGKSTSVSSYVKTAGTSWYAFTYHPGYQEAGKPYALLGYPTNHSFNPYVVHGDWQP